MPRGRGDRSEAYIFPDFSHNVFRQKIGFTKVQVQGSLGAQSVHGSGHHTARQIPFKRPPTCSHSGRRDQMIARMSRRRARGGCSPW